MKYLPEKEQKNDECVLNTKPRPSFTKTASARAPVRH